MGRGKEALAEKQEENQEEGRVIDDLERRVLRRKAESTVVIHTSERIGKMGTKKY